VTRSPENDSRDESLDQVLEVLRGFGTGLSEEALAGAVTCALPKPFQRRQTAKALARGPRLLAGEGVCSSPGVIRLIDVLASQGARGVAAPACPYCHVVTPLKFGRDGVRCCRRCYDLPRREPCSRCGREESISTRTSDGEPLCGPCYRRDPDSHQECSQCGRTAPVQGRDASGAPLCRVCWRAPLAMCSDCGKLRPCSRSGTSAPQCGTCYKRGHKDRCSSCGNVRGIAARTKDGDPLCQMCGAKREPCSSCGRVRRVTGRPGGRALCRTCYRKDPSLLRPCGGCATVTRLYHHGLCPGCALPGQARATLAPPGQPMRADLEPVAAALTRGDAALALKWLEGQAARRLLAALAAGTGPVTHHVLDQLGPARNTAYLRAALVDAGTLPRRDEYLAAFERWLPGALAGVADSEDCKIIRSYATWEPLRRLRRQSSRRPLNHGQQMVARSDVQAAIRLAGWLRARKLSLSTCQQDDIDQWLAVPGPGHFLARNFLGWCTSRGYARNVEIPAGLRQHDRTVTTPGTGQRWSIARDLLHGPGHATIDRVAGCLVLLYAQPLTRIAALTLGHVTESPAELSLSLGSHPVDIPEPLADLIRELTTRRRGHTAIGCADDSKWLFPGGQPGRAISPQRLAARLALLGIPARVARTTALIDLAGQLPATVLSRLLGINLATATLWNQAAGNTRAGYAAQVARCAASRDRTTGEPG
jgi:hypothetical protein